MNVFYQSCQKNMRYIERMECHETTECLIKKKELRLRLWEKPVQGGHDDCDAQQMHWKQSLFSNSLTDDFPTQWVSQAVCFLKGIHPHDKLYVVSWRIVCAPPLVGWNYKKQLQTGVFILEQVLIFSGSYSYMYPAVHVSGIGHSLYNLGKRLMCLFNLKCCLAHIEITMLKYNGGPELRNDGLYIETCPYSSSPIDGIWPGIQPSAIGFITYFQYRSSVVHVR